MIDILGITAIPGTSCHNHILRVFCRWVEPTPEDVFAFLPPLSNVAQEDILLLTLSVDHTAGTKNPLEAVRFFDRWEDETAHHLDPRHMSGFHYECYKVGPGYIPADPK